MAKSKITKIIYILALCLIFVLGTYLRLKTYMTNLSFWHDECALAWNVLNKSYLQLFQPLRFMQVAPPLFLISTKLRVHFFGTDEMVFRFAPFMASVASMIVFYFVSKKLLVQKWAVLIVNYLFAINFALYYYASEFKPYSLDVLYILLTVLIFSYINKKNAFIFSVILSVFVWLSFPTVFFILAGTLFFIINKQFDKKEKLLYLLPQLINFSLFLVYFKTIYNVASYGMLNFWDNYFLNLNNFETIIKTFVEFSVAGSVLAVILLVFGAFLLIKEKNKTAFQLLTVIAIIALLSAFKLYPLSGRLILFMIPIVVIFYAKSLDSKKILVYVLFAVSLIPQIKSVHETLMRKELYKPHSNPREMVSYLKTNAKSSDIIYINKNSNADFLYYKDIYKLDNKYCIEFCSDIKKGDKVWFFVPNGNDLKTVEYLKNEYKIIYKNGDMASFLAFGIKK